MNLTKTFSDISKLRFYCKCSLKYVWYCFLLLKFLLGGIKRYVHVGLAASIYANCVSISMLGLFPTIFFDPCEIPVYNDDMHVNKQA